MMNKHQILESLNIYRDQLLETPNAFGLFEYGDPENDNWIPDIVSGRSEHEYQQEKISRNPFSTKQVKVGAANTKLGDVNSTKMNFYNTEKGKYKRNDVDAAKKAKTGKTSTDGKEFIDPAEIGIRFTLKFGVPMLHYNTDMKHMLGANSDKIKQLPPELCKSKIEDPRFDYLTWTRDDIKKLQNGLWTDLKLGYVVTKQPISHSQLTPVGVSYHGKFPEGASTVIPSGIINELYTRSDESENELYMYIPKSEYIDFHVSTLKSEYIRFIDMKSGDGGIMKINQHFPFSAGK